MNVGLDVGELGQLDAIAQLEDPLVIGTPITESNLLIGIVAAQLSIGGAEDQAVLVTTREGADVLGPKAGLKGDQGRANASMAANIGVFTTVLATRSASTIRLDSCCPSQPSGVYS